MTQPTSAFRALLEAAKNFVTTSIELIKLQVIHKIAGFLASLVSFCLISLFMLLFFFFFNIGVGLWLGKVLGSNWYGFFAVSGFYFLLATLLIIFKDKWPNRMLRNRMVKQMFK